MNEEKIKQEDVNIEFSQDAIEQLNLIFENDYTLENHFFRIKVDGKGCGGFDYALGFTPKQQDDFVIDIAQANKKLQFIIDPFTAFYAKNGIVNYIKDYANNAEGFHFENSNEKNYRGKFFKDESKLPIL